MTGEEAHETHDLKLPKLWRKKDNEGSPRKLSVKKSFRTEKPASDKVRASEDKNEPSRFLGEGVSFKAKLIGILEVNEARGDRMCQEALADLKMAIRAAGEHKQRININIAIDGLRLRDEKTGDCLYHHPVHKISFIAQDMSDSRAFGYIFGSPDTGHRFFGIKTDKAASQVVIAMRDLFQVVFELKKKEIELAKQHIEQHQIKVSSGLFGDGGTVSKNGLGSSELGTSKMRTIQEDTTKDDGTTSSKSAQQTSEVIADLLDLEFELNSIQQGIHQMERITPSDPFGPSSIKQDPFGSDPFGDSFTSTSTIAAPAPSKTSVQPIAVLPPPPSVKDSIRPLADPFNVPPPSRGTNRRSSARTASTEHFSATVPSTTVPPATQPVQIATVQQEKHWFDQETESLFDEGELVTPPITSNLKLSSYPTIPSLSDQEEKEFSKSPPNQNSSKQFDVFTELDPLGTGRSKPYIDRKDFFQELKNPPKKVLKDLVTEAPTEATAPLFQANFENNSNNLNTSDTDHCPLDNVVLPNTDPSTSSVSALTTSNMGVFSSNKAFSLDVDPFEDTDPFHKTDPFEEDDFPQLPGFPPLSNANDPFDTGFADFTMFGKTHKSEVFSTNENITLNQENGKKSVSPLPPSESASPQTFHGPLRVTLPPETEDAGTSISSRQPSSQSASGSSLTISKSKSKTSRINKQATLGGIVKLPSPKSSQRSSRLVKQMTVDVCSNSNNNNPPRLSPTPPMPPTPSRLERRSPSGQGILESVTLRNRCSITPSPPVVATFPETMDDSTSRLSGSSAELAEIAPEPPPRPATSITTIKPPPLPPKRQQAGTIMKPPPRPPHIEDQHYDYIENYETSSPPSLDAEDINSPPIPVPARRPRFSDMDSGTIPQRPRRQLLISKLSTSSESDYLTPFPLLPPPQKKSPSDSTRHQPKSQVLPSANIQPASTALSSEKQSKPATSLNITLSQLTKTGLQDLATALGVSPGHLSNMTLQDLTKCLSKLSGDGISSENNAEEIKSKPEVIKRDKYATLRESVDDEPEFKAEFEANFDKVDQTEKLEDVFQEAPFDKYAVFRELIGHVKSDQQKQEEIISDENDAVQLSETKLETIAENILESPREIEDRYAALREISIANNLHEKDDIDTSSDKEDSITEAIKADDDDDLLTLSRQQSESTESPTIEAVTYREPQSIIETTILEEDVSALEADEVSQDTPEHVNAISEELNAENESSVAVIDTDVQAAIRAEKMDSSPSEKEDVADNLVEGKQLSKEEISPQAEGWAKFDVAEKASGGQSEGGGSPWSADGKEIPKISSTCFENPLDYEQENRREKKRHPPQWQDDDESEEGWEERRGEVMWAERQWRENGWSDGESFYEDVPHRKERLYPDDRLGRRKVAPWKGSHRSSRDTSPWGQDTKDEDEDWGGVNKKWHDRSVEDDEDDEEYEVYRKNRPKHHGHCREDERRRRYEHRDINGMEYEDTRKRRPSPWGSDDRRSSWESGSWDEDERFTREYSDRHMRSDREESYRRRRDPEVDGRAYNWNRKCLPSDEEYVRPEQTRRKERHYRYYRDRSRESPWEDDYSEQGEEESPRYLGRKRNWPKRPSSASETRWNIEKNSPGDYKPRSGEKQQHSLPSMSRGDRMDSSEKVGSYNFADRRYREKMGSRPRSREGHFNSDQEYDYWPQQERSRRSEREMCYEQRSQTLHSRRTQRHKKGSDHAYSQKSPFDDDFSMQVFDFSADTKGQGGESDASDTARRKSPSLYNNITPTTAFKESFSKHKDLSTGDISTRPKEIGLSSPHEHQKPPLLEEVSKIHTPRGSTHRQSPFEDDFTPPETNRSTRLTSSISSDVSDHRKSPFDELKPGSGRVQSVTEESDVFNKKDKNSVKLNDDVFLPTNSVSEGSKVDNDQVFADFDSSVFVDSVSELVPRKPSISEGKEKRGTVNIWNSEETNKHQSGLKLRISNLMRVDSSSSIRKSESINIFARENDPFDDDFFSSETTSTVPRPRSENASHTPDKSNSNNNDGFKWTKAFDSFNFEDEK